MPAESMNKKKWWHASLSIRNRDSGVILKNFTTINSSSPDTNASSIIKAYATNSINCESAIDIPVSSFDTFLSPGYFVFSPTVANLENIVININTYQESINLNNRYEFEYKRYAAYSSVDTDCSATAPDSIDSSPYEVITNNLVSNIFRYPEMPQYTQIGCCSFERSIPSSDLPSIESTGRATRLWFLIYNNSTYSLYSYDFALLSNASVFRGNISLPSNVTKIFDITWIPTDNSLVALCDSGIYRLSPGDSSTNAILGNNISITTSIISHSLFPIISPEIDSYKCSLEYNYYDNNLYMFSPIYNAVTSESSPAFIVLRYESGHFVFSNFDTVSTIISDEEKAIGGFVFSESSDPLGIYQGNLAYLRNIGQSSASIERVTSEYPSANLLSGMSTLCFAKHPDTQINENRIYSTNNAGQVFSVDSSLGSANSLGITLSGTPIGASTVINGEDTRIQPFPFSIGKSHWLFMIDISSTMAGNRMPLIKAALIKMLQTYVRYGDKITILWFGNSYDKITKELKTYADSNEVINYINAFLITQVSGGTNFCTPFSNISQDFATLKNIIILSDGSFDDCGVTESEWMTSLSSSVNNIISSNNGVSFTCVGVRASSGTEKLEYIAQVSNGVYVNWM